MFAWAGYRVCICDLESQHDEMTVLTEIRKLLKDVDADGASRGSLSVYDTLNRISVTTNLADCVADCIYIQVSTICC